MSARFMRNYTKMTHNYDECEFGGVKKVTNCTTFDRNCVDQVVALLDQYKRLACKETSPEEFVKEVVCSQKLFVETPKESIVYLFLKICSFDKFITSLLDEVHIPINAKTIGKLFSFFSKTQNT